MNLSISADCKNSMYITEKLAIFVNKIVRIISEKAKSRLCVSSLPSDGFFVQ